MLILSRRAGDAIVIEGGIRIVVLASDRRGVRLGIEAPPHVSIVREEILSQIADENRRANVGAEAAALVGGPAASLVGGPAAVLVGGAAAAQGGVAAKTE
jgi:carbon storage regulator